MKVVVNDANILIDLIKLELLGHFFSLNWEFHSTELIIENELYYSQKLELEPYIVSGKLLVQTLSAEDIEAIMEMQAEKPQLSNKDCSALLCAQKLNASMVTSDNALRRFAQQLHVDVHGHLWIFDALIAQNCILPDLAIVKLNELNKGNSWLNLPKNEVEIRLASWAKL